MTTNGLECIVISIAGKKAEVEIEGQKITVNSLYLPKNAASGQTVKLFFLAGEEATLEEKKLAKSILEHILNGT